MNLSVVIVAWNSAEYLARTLPEELLRRHEAFPVLRVADELTVIITDPTNQQAVSDLEAVTGMVLVALGLRIASEA